MRTIKNNKLIFILGFICLAIVIAILVFAISLIPTNSEEGKYGNRLDGIENYKIDDTKIEEMKNAIKGQDGVKSVNYNLNGRLINVTINVDDTLDPNRAKEYAGSIIPYFEGELLTYYDLQVLINSEAEESGNYPKIGYKYKTSDSLVWEQ